VAWFQVLFSYLPGGTEESKKTVSQGSRSQRVPCRVHAQFRVRFLETVNTRI
jgi:hypothetical protein